ncbi:MAG: hypothetical protein AAFO07_33570, partial [Bacteroidota bacterium]
GQSEQGINIDGLYDVLLHIDGKQDKNQVTQKIETLLLNNRNICEDFAEIRFLKPLDIKINAKLTIGPDIIGESILANIWFAIDEILTPHIKRYNPKELLETGHPIQDIFDGPTIVNGYIKPEDLVRTSFEKIMRISKSELVKAINDIEGVNSVIDFAIEVDGSERRAASFEVPYGMVPKLDSENSNFELIVNEVTYEPDNNTAKYIYQTLKNKQVKVLKKQEKVISEDQFSSDINKSDIEYYFSLQHTFPKLYGLGIEGLPSKVTEDRRAYSRQLKGYLLCYEQLMANHLSQLSYIEELFKLDNDLHTTYYSQVPVSVPRLEDLTAMEEATYKEQLTTLVAKYDNKYIRRLRFLDHLLARFGEKFFSETLRAIDKQAGNFDEVTYLQKSIASRIEYLTHIISISARRSLGTNYKSTEHSKTDVAGLKRRISLFFNLTDYTHKKLSDAWYDKASSYSVGNKPNLKKLTKGSFTFTSKNPNIRSILLKYGTNPDNYFINEVDEKITHVSFINPFTDEEFKVYTGETVQDCKNAVDQLINRLNHINESSEGFHMLEHVLLRPVREKQTRIVVNDDTSRLL